VIFPWSSTAEAIRITEAGPKVSRHHDRLADDLGEPRRLDGLPGSWGGGWFGCGERRAIDSRIVMLYI